MKGKIIAVMGIDGSGKTTLVENLKKCSSGIDKIKCMSIFENSIFTKELESVAQQQGKTRRECFSKELRSIIWRTDLINNVFNDVIPELENGNIIILDRYKLCNKVYSNLEISDLGHMDRMLEILPNPDLGIYLDVDIDVALSRINNRNNRELAPYEKKEGLIALKERYEKLIQQENYNIIKVDANLSEKEVTKCALDSIIREIENSREEDICEREYI